MGRKSKLTESQWEAVLSENWHGMAHEFVTSKDDEGCITLMLRMHCIFGQISKMLKTTRIDRYRFEYAVNGGRIDLALFHSDGGVSLIEVKGQNSIRDVVAGIGQLFFYESMFLASKPKAKPPTYINKYLISPIQGEDSEKVDRACALAGVGFLAYAPFSLIRQHREDCRREWLEPVITP